MKIQRTCTRLVKPCCTITDGAPPLLVPLSNCDLVFDPEHVGIIYAYRAPAPPTTALEAGLQKVLCEFREFAGRMIPASYCTSHDPHAGSCPSCRERPAIQLNDEGAVLIEAEAHGSLQELWPFNPSPVLLDLAPVSDSAQELLLIQVTRFACGGMTLGITSQHQVADGISAIDFTQAWAAMVQGLPIAFSPLHDRSALMGSDHPEPVMDHTREYQMTPSNYIHNSNVAVKRLHFSAQLLRKVKAKAAMAASESADRIVFSTFASLLVHLWKCITIAQGLEDAEGDTRAVIPVNIRDRLDPPLAKEFFGNALCHVYQQVKIKDLVNKPLSFTASHTHDSIKRVNDEYARSSLDFVELQRKKKNHVQLAQLEKGEICVASWVTLPLYSLDFGCGTPIFAGPSIVSLEGMVFFTPSHKQDGSIDVVLSLFAPHMEKLEAICYEL